MVIVLAVLVVGGLVWLVQRNGAGGGAGRGAADGGGPVNGARGGAAASVGTESGMPAEPHVGKPIPAGRRALGRIVFDGLTKKYAGVTVVDEVSFTAGPGRITGFLGPNGAGKTTTLRMLLGLVEPLHASVILQP